MVSAPEQKRKQTVAPNHVEPNHSVKALDPAELQRAFDESQQQLRQLRAENQHLLKARTASQRNLAHLKDDFISVVSHELRTPLTAVHGGVKLLSQGHIQSETEQGQALIQLIAQNSQRLVRVVNNIVDLQYLTSAEAPLHTSVVNTQDITGPLADTYRPIGGQAHIKVTVCDPGFEITCDRDRITQVLTNLLDNAHKFSPPNTTIQLTVEREARASKTVKEQKGKTISEPFLLFKMHDQGLGISAEHCTPIFERFVQVDASNTRRQGGTGLGLAICRSIIEWHGGRIWAESVPGEGSCFAFTLPIC